MVNCFRSPIASNAEWKSTKLKQRCQNSKIRPLATCLLFRSFRRNTNLHTLSNSLPQDERKIRLIKSLWKVRYSKKLRTQLKMAMKATTLRLNVTCPLLTWEIQVRSSYCWRNKRTERILMIFMNLLLQYNLRLRIARHMDTSDLKNCIKRSWDCK